MRKLSLFFLLVAFCAFPALTTHAANLVLNGSFEDEPPPEPWPHYGPVAYWYNLGGNLGSNDNTGPFWDNGYKMNGAQVGFLQGTGVLSQDVDGFVTGQQYTLRFLENLRNTSLEVDLTVRVGGNEVVASHRVAVGEFALVEVNFASPGEGIFTLEFDSLVAGDGTLVIDGVSIVPQGEANPFPPSTLPPRPNVIIANGSFEDEAKSPTWPHYGPVRWWTGLNGLNDNLGPFWDNGVEANGAQVAFRQNAGVVSQVGVGFQAGQQYTLRYSVNSRNCCCPPEGCVPPGIPLLDLEVKLNSVVLVPNQQLPLGEFEHYTVDFLSPGTGDFLLEFVFTNPTLGDATGLLDAVSIVKQGQPDPFPAYPLCWPINVLKTITTPTIDGVVNVATEYPNAQVVDLRLGTTHALDPWTPTCLHSGTYTFPGVATPENDADNSALIYFLWDSQALYLAVVGNDQQLNPQTNDCGQYACPDAGVNRGDTFQLCLDYDQTNATDGQQDETRVYIPSWALIENANDPQWFQSFWPLSNPNPFTGMTYNMKTNATGYVLEARIPWTAFTSGGEIYTNPFPPVNGQTCGVLPMLEDHDDGAVSFMYTAGNNSNIIVNASQYNDLIFLDVTTIENWAQY